MVGEEGEPILSNGLASIRYQNKDEATIYSPNPINIVRLSKEEESEARAASRASSKKGTKRKSESQAGSAYTSKARTGWKQSVPSNKGKNANDHADDAEDLIASFAADSVICFTDGACRGNPGPCGAGAVICLPSEGMTAQEAVAKSSSWIEKYVALGHGTNNIGELTAIEIALQLIEKAEKEYQTYRQQHPEELIESKTEIKQHTQHTQCDLCQAALADDAESCDDCGQSIAGIVSTSRSKPPPRVPSTVHILSDSKYAIGTLDPTLNWKAKKNVELVDRIKDALARLSRTHKIHIHWVKAHAGVPGNERADQLANRGVTESC